MKLLAKQIALLFCFIALLAFGDAAPIAAQSGLGGLGQVPLATVRFGLECRDGLDNNLDGKIDLDDPNCGSKDDASEWLPTEQRDTLVVKDLQCDGREDVLGVNMVNIPILRTVWKVILCPAKVDRNCDGRSDLTGTPIFDEPHYQYQCRAGHSTDNKDRNCDGFDDRYPNIDLRQTDYWNQICPDPTKYTDADCDGFDDKLGDNLLKPATIGVWYSLCPAKVDRNCDARADISGLAYFTDITQLSRNPTQQELDDYELASRQCPAGFKQAPDRDCNGQDDNVLYYTSALTQGVVPPTCLQIADPNYTGPRTPEPVCLDITNTDYWKNACKERRLVTFSDADCNGIEDELGINLLQSGYLYQWRNICPAKVDRNCDGYADLSGSEYGNTVDRNNNPIKLNQESHYKYQCPNGSSIQTATGGYRDANCDGFDDLSYTEKKIDYVNGQYQEVSYRERIDLTNTEYWKRQCVKKPDYSKGIIGSNPFYAYKGSTQQGGGHVDENISCRESGYRFLSFGTILCSILNFITQIALPFLFLAATIFFMYGVIKFYMAAPSSAARVEGRRYIIWAIIAIFLMVSVWGVIRLVTTTLGFGSVIPLLKQQ